MAPHPGGAPADDEAPAPGEARLNRWPHAGVAVPGLPVELDVRRVPVDRYPYHLIYLLADGAIRILAVTHDR